jgi:signal transduction histidine kinase
MRARLLTGLLLFVLIVTVALELPLGFDQQARVRTAEHNSLLRSASSLAVLVSDALDHREPARAREVATRYVRASHLGVVVTTAHAVLLSAGSAQSGEVASPALAKVLRAASSTVSSGQAALPAGSGDVLYAVIIVDDHAAGTARQRAVLLVTEPADLVDDAVNAAWLKLAGIGAGVLIAATALGLLISASLARPLMRIESAVTAIGAGALDTRAPTDTGPAELRNLGAAVNSTASRLSRLLQAQQAFAANASHQLRSPLTAIRLQLEQAQRTLPPDAAARVAAALDEVRRLSRMVNALLELAQDEAKRPAKVNVDVTGVIGERLEAWRPLADEQGLQLVSSGVVADRLMVLACPETVEQVLDNLLANAFEATPAGGIVSVDASPQGSFVEIHVVDDGCGLGPGEHARAFDRFWRGAGSRPEGSGLGLAIVDHLVQLSGGSAELRPRAEGGTDAIVWMPTV